MVTDTDGGGTADQIETITINNVAPHITNVLANPTDISESQSSTITVTAEDVAADLPLGYHFDCNNAQFFEVKQTGGNSTVCAFPEGSIHQVNVAVLDKDGGVDTSFTTVTVGNVAPIVTPVADVVSVEQGFELVLSPNATFTDPGALDTHTATVDWDDGNIDQVLLAEVHFAALLEGAQEVPPVAVGEAGLGVLAINTAQTELQFLIEVDENLLTGPIISAPYPQRFSWRIRGRRTYVDTRLRGGVASGDWTAGDVQSFSAAMVSELLACNLYVNIHTSLNPGSEVRGQLVPQPLPASIRGHHWHPQVRR